MPEPIPLASTWKTIARAAERQVFLALDRAEDAVAADFAAQARADVGVDEGRRYIAQLRLTAAIACAHPDDARAILSAALEDLGAGMPKPHHPFDRLREDAQFWADTASEAELAEYSSAAIKRLETAPLALRMRKRLLAVLFQSLPEADRRAFLGRVDPRGIFQGGRV